jgi:hypothetical protein
MAIFRDHEERVVKRGNCRSLDCARDDKGRVADLG